MNMQKETGPVQFPIEDLPDHGTRLSDRKRLAALAATGVMDTPAEDVFDRTVRLATNLLQVPVGLASFVDADRQFFKAQCGLSVEADGNPLRETPLSHSFCQYVVAHDMTLAVEDARTHPLLRSNHAIEDLGVVAYLGVPIHAPSGEAIGSFCAIEGTPRHWTERDVEVLTDLAAMIETELQLRHERDAMQTLARELNHRVKNLFTVVGGMVALTARAAESPAEMAKVLQGRMSALDSAHDMISPSLAKGDMTGDQIDLETLIARLVEPHLLRGPDQLRIDVPEAHLSGQAVTDLALVIHEMATNAAKYGALSDAGGLVEIDASLSDQTMNLTWRETGGPEIAQEPIEKGFGSRLIEVTLARQMHGALDTVWHRTGVEHRLSVPLSVFDPDTSG